MTYLSITANTDNNWKILYNNPDAKTQEVEKLSTEKNDLDKNIFKLKITMVALVALGGVAAIFVSFQAALIITGLAIVPYLMMKPLQAKVAALVQDLQKAQEEQKALIETALTTRTFKPQDLNSMFKSSVGTDQQEAYCYTKLFPQLSKKALSTIIDEQMTLTTPSEEFKWLCQMYATANHNGSISSKQEFWKDFFIYSTLGIQSSMYAINPTFTKEGYRNVELKDKKALDNISRIQDIDKTIKIEGISIEYPRGFYEIKQQDVENLAAAIPSPSYINLKGLNTDKIPEVWEKNVKHLRYHFMYIKTLNLPEATIVDLHNIPGLKSVSAPKAQALYGDMKHVAVTAPSTCKQEMLSPTAKNQ